MNKKYTSIQCIDFNINTHFNGFGYRNFGEDSEDMLFRTTLIAKVIKKAAMAKEINNNPNCLKIFMVPEFFFRGKDGAYSMNTTAQLVKNLRRIVLSPLLKDWLFVFGTTVAYSKPHYKQSQDFETYNFSFIQKGNASESESFVVMKEFKSEVDFINTRINNFENCLTNHNTHHLPLAKPSERRIEEKKFNYDGNCIFEINGIRFGVEICLDNINQRINFSNTKGQKPIDVLLIPACGTSKTYPCNNFSKNGLIFTCDGNGADRYSEVKLANNFLVPKLTIHNLVSYSGEFPFNKKNEGTLNIFATHNLSKNLYRSMNLVDY